MAGFIAGGDYKILDCLYAGAMTGFTSSHVNFHQDRGSGDINTGYLGLYLAASDDDYFGSLSVTGGWNNYSSDRRIQYPGVDLTATSDHGGRQILTHADIGLNFSFGWVDVRPFDRLDYFSQRENSYTEEGAGE